MALEVNIEKRAGSFHLRTAFTCEKEFLGLLGASGSGKSMAWRVLLKALERLEGVEGVAHIIDPKAISKDHLYGTLDPNTREWTDGLFTHVLRK